MEKQKSFKLVEKWATTGKLFFYGTVFVESFLDWLYEKGFTIETRFQGEDLKKQEKLIDSKD